MSWVLYTKSCLDVDVFASNYLITFSFFLYKDDNQGSIEKIDLNL